MHEITIVRPVSPAVEALARQSEPRRATGAETRGLEGKRVGFRVDWPSFHVFSDEAGSYLRDTEGVVSTPWWDLNVEESDPHLRGGRSYDQDTADALLRDLLDRSDAVVVGLAN
jgi:hypothetical protein